jgi:hypothetical protein
LANETQIDGGSWNVGIDNGVSAADVVEGYVPRAAIGNPTQVTAAFFSTRDGFSDLLKTQDGSSTGAKIVVLLGAASVSSVAIPTLSEAMLLLLATLTALMGFRYAQRHGTTLVACTVAIMIGSATHRGVEAAVTILMDGLV